MFRNIRIDPKTGFAYIPKEIRNDGFTGDVECLPNAITLTIIKPGTPLERVKQSLEVAIKDLELRIELERDKKC